VGWGWVGWGRFKTLSSPLVVTGFRPLHDANLQNRQSVADKGCHLRGFSPHKGIAYRGVDCKAKIHDQILLHPSLLHMGAQRCIVIICSGSSLADELPFLVQLTLSFPTSVPLLSPGLLVAEWYADNKLRAGKICSPTSVPLLLPGLFAAE
jgi:hypothetical protein